MFESESESESRQQNKGKERKCSFSHLLVKIALLKNLHLNSCVCPYMSSHVTSVSMSVVCTNVNVPGVVSPLLKNVFFIK